MIIGLCFFCRIWFLAKARAASALKPQLNTPELFWQMDLVETCVR